MVTGQAATLLVRNTRPSTAWLESHIKRHVIFFSIDICVLTFGFFAVFGIDKDTLNSSIPIVFFKGLLYILLLCLWMFQTYLH